MQSQSLKQKSDLKQEEDWMHCCYLDSEGGRAENLRRK